MSTRAAVERELVDVLVSAGVDRSWVANFVESLSGDDWNHYNALDDVERRLWAEQAARQWANDLYMQGVPVPESLDYEVFGGWTSSEVSGEAWPVDGAVSAEAAETAAQVEQTSKMEEAQERLDDGDPAGAMAIIQDVMGVSGESLFGYEEQLRTAGKIDSATGMMSVDAQAEFLEGVNAYTDTYGLDVSFTEAGDAVQWFNESLTASQKWALFGRIFETESQMWHGIDVPGVGTVTVRQSDIEQVTARLPDVGIVEIEEAMIAAEINGVDDWELVLFAADATNRLFFDVPEVPPRRRRGESSQEIQERRRGQQRRRTFDDIAAAVADGVGRYGDSILGYLHAVDPTVAAAVYTDPYNLSGEQVAAKDAALVKLDDAYLSSPRVDIAYSQDGLTWLRELGNDTPETIEPPSELDVKEGMRALYRSWFLTDPSDQELDDFVKHFNDQQSAYAASRDTAFNPYRGTAGVDPQAPTIEASSMEYLRAHDDYTGLFSNRPEGMSEAAYAQAFRSKAASVLGTAEGALNVGAARAGMRSGDTASVGQHAVMSGAGYESSTFMQRLARGADVLKRMT